MNFDIVRKRARRFPSKA